MSSNSEITVFPIAQTKINPEAVRQWLDHIGAGDFEVPQNVTDPALLIALAAKRCYMSFEPGLNPNVTKVRKDYVDYFDNILRQKHGSVFEHSSYTFAIEGVSRVFTGEMNRHRAGWSISEGSMRFIRFDKDIPFWMPTSLRDDPHDDIDLTVRKSHSRDIFHEVFDFVQNRYSQLLKEWDMEEGNHNFSYKKRVTSCLRRIVPMGVSTGGLWSGNIRACRHVIAMRASAAAEEEIFYVFQQVADHMIKSEPMLFGDFHKSEDGSLVPEHWKV